MQERTSFKVLREQQGLSLKQAGKLLDLDPSLVNRIENGIRQPTREQLMKLAEFYQLDPDALLVDWISDRLLQELKDEALAGRILQAVERKLELDNH